MRAKGDIRQVILCVKITHKELEFSKVDDLLLIDDELGKDFSHQGIECQKFVLLRIYGC